MSKEDGVEPLCVRACVRTYVCVRVRFFGTHTREGKRRGGIESLSSSSP